MRYKGSCLHQKFEKASGLSFLCSDRFGRWFGTFRYGLEPFEPKPEGLKSSLEKGSDDISIKEGINVGMGMLQVHGQEMD